MVGLPGERGTGYRGTDEAVGGWVGRSSSDGISLAGFLLALKMESGKGFQFIQYYDSEAGLGRNLVRILLIEKYIYMAEYTRSNFVRLLQLT